MASARCGVQCPEPRYQGPAAAEACGLDSALTCGGALRRQHGCGGVITGTVRSSCQENRPASEATMLIRDGEHKKCTDQVLLKQNSLKGGNYICSDMIFLPGNQNNRHWYTIVVNAKKRRVQSLDSMCTSPNFRPLVQITIPVGNNCRLGFHCPSLLNTTAWNSE